MAFLHICLLKGLQSLRSLRDSSLAKVLKSQVSGWVKEGREDRVHRSQTSEAFFSLFSELLFV